MKQRLLATCMLLAALVGAACSAGKEQRAPWVALVQQAHESADSQAKLGEAGDDRRAPTDTVGAERALRLAIAGAPRAPSPAERWIIQDLHYRLAQLLTDLGKANLAEPEIERGLGVDDTATLARANLFALLGKINEKRGDLEAATQAYHAALLINEVLMDRALNGSTERGNQQP